NMLGIKHIIFNRLCVYGIITTSKNFVQENRSCVPGCKKARLFLVLENFYLIIIIILQEGASRAWA
ncbi:hypothetical protein HMPREF9370_0480, partial [Neisseria wadsworthii 9715]